MSVAFGRLSSAGEAAESMCARSAQRPATEPHAGQCLPGAPEPAERERIVPTTAPAEPARARPVPSVAGRIG